MVGIATPEVSCEAYVLLYTLYCHETYVFLLLQQGTVQMMRSVGLVVSPKHHASQIQGLFSHLSTLLANKLDFDDRWDEFEKHPAFAHV